MGGRAVLLGAGHAHLGVLKRASGFAGRGHELVVVAPERFWYSGLATGMLGGEDPPGLDQVDIAALAAPRRFRPKRRYLWIMNLGDGTGLAARGGLWWHGRAAHWLKNRIDRRFLRGYQRAARC